MHHLKKKVNKVTIHQLGNLEQVTCRKKGNKITTDFQLSLKQSFPKVEQLFSGEINPNFFERVLRESETNY